MSARYNARQRKKLRLGEFRELGFSVDCTLAAPLSETAQSALLDALTSECIEANGMVMGGGIGDTLSSYVVSDQPRGSVTPEQRAAVQTWLEKRSEFSERVIGPLSDVWRP